MKWRLFSHQGVSYDLSHLDPFEWYYTARARGKRSERTYRFHVTFSMHCFTRGSLIDEKVSEGLWYEGPREKRVFCFDRYELSRQLPAIIRSLGDRNCYHTSHGNFFTVELITEEGKRIEYEVYFDVIRAGRKGWLNLIVNSAYERTKDNETARLRKRKIHLDVIAYNRQSGKGVHPGR